MDIEIDLSKSIDENASFYFNESKLAKRKVEGLKKALNLMQQKVSKREEIDAKKELIAKQKKDKERVSKKWFYSFRWFFTSDNFLVVGGRDAISNEKIVKNKMKKNDVYFHADVFGAPHCIIVAPEKLKGEVFVPPFSSMNEAACFAATFSKAWEEARPIADVYSVKPEQVSKSARPGESMGTGAFMIYGERNWFKKTVLSCAVGYFPREQRLMCGPINAIKFHCKNFFELKHGSKSKEVISRELKALFEKKGLFFELDEFVSIIPNGGFELK
jgi:predicted ribosome quality control (RQC) complex YloA/Tae2 family protein